MPFHYAGRFQTAEGFLSLINKITDQAMNSVLTLQTEDHWTPFAIALSHQTADVVTVFLNKATRDTIDHVLVVQETTHGKTSLDCSPFPA